MTLKKNQKKEEKNFEEIKSLKITVRPLNQDDIKQRKLPNQTTGLSYN